MLNKKLLLNEVVNDNNVRPLSDKERELLKKTLLDMTEDIDTVCRKYGIKMFLTGGSLLGAVRHKGFIPWDDDVDFGMTREDYSKFITIFDGELSDRYYLRCPNTRYPNGNRFMQIFKIGTIVETMEGSTPLQPDCLAIDIFPYDPVPDNVVYRFFKGLWCNLLMVIASAVTDFKYANDTYRQLMRKTCRGKILNAGMSALGFLFSWKSPADWFNAVDIAIRYKKNSDYITSATGRKHYFGETFPANVIFPLQEIEFENLMLYAPAKPDVYLVHNYGNDYMVLPPVEKRESHFIKRLVL